MKKLLFSSILLGFGTLSIIAQSGTKSPYSQYGLGILSDQSQGFNRGMSGVFQGFRSGNQVNMQNPASYSAVDSGSGNSISYFFIRSIYRRKLKSPLKEVDSKATALSISIRIFSRLIFPPGIAATKSRYPVLVTTSSISSFTGRNTALFLNSESMSKN